MFCCYKKSTFGGFFVFKIINNYFLIVKILCFIVLLVKQNILRFFTNIVVSYVVNGNNQSNQKWHILFICVKFKAVYKKVKTYTDFSNNIAIFNNINIALEPFAFEFIFAIATFNIIGVFKIKQFVGYLCNFELVLKNFQNLLRTT